MACNTFGFGMVRGCGVLFHVEYECPGCHEIGFGPANNTRFDMTCSDTGQKYVVVGFLPNSSKRSRTLSNTL
jgi:hypothetical protein